MTTILSIEASARGTGSLSRALSERFLRQWQDREPGARVIARDVGRNPPRIVSEAWIAAAFTPAAERRGEQRELLQASDEMIDEVRQADVIAIATPMYNYGMPAALKAWFDQVIRVNETFSFDLARGDWPLKPILSGKTIVVLSSRGEFGFGRGGVREHMNHLETHIETCAHYLGALHRHFVSIDYQEFADERHAASRRNAFRKIDALVAELSPDGARQAGDRPRPDSVTAQAASRLHGSRM